MLKKTYTHTHLPTQMCVCVHVHVPVTPRLHTHMFVCTRGESVCRRVKVRMCAYACVIYIHVYEYIQVQTHKIQKYVHICTMRVYIGVGTSARSTALVDGRAQVTRHLPLPL